MSDGWHRFGVPLFVVATIFLLVGCQKDDSNVVAKVQPEHGQFACFRCHSRERLEGVKPSDGTGMAGYLRAAAGGLKRRPVIVPDGRNHYSFDMHGNGQGRGQHPVFERARCFDCHAILPNGMGHGTRVYPGASATAGAGKDCASGCHIWLRKDTTITGPSGLSWRGSQRPADLLASNGNPHGSIWRKGWEQSGSDSGFLVTRIAPGCYGCHAVLGVSHGDAPTCLDCHVWDNSDASGGPHAKHLARIGGKLAPGMTQSCGWCHAFGAPESKVAAGACYNCHLSGHDPLGSDGTPQLGP